MNKLKLKILSIFIFTFFSTLFAQESNEIILGKSNYIWNGTQYQIQDTFINTFDKEYNITSSLILIWDSVSKSFIYNELSSKNTFIYDKRKNLISELVEKWDSSLKKLTFFYENLYTYDDKNNIISFFKKDQQILSGFKEERFIYVYTYDKYNKLISKLELKTNFNEKVKEDYNYINYYNYKYFYNDKNKLTHEFHELWDSYNKKFTEDTKIIYTYDSVNNCLSYTGC